MENTKPNTLILNQKKIYTIGAFAALFQLFIIVVGILLAFVFGVQPENVKDYFEMYAQNKMIGLIRDDLASLLIISMYLGVFPALFFALKQVNTIAVAFSVLFVFIGVTICYATHSAFSMMHLSDAFTSATVESQRSQILAAGEAVIATNMWNSTGGYISGIFLQGSGILISLVMYRCHHFSKVTAISGLLGNAIDLLQHLIHPFAPQVSSIVMPLMSPFYLAWFPMLARDLFRLAKKNNPANI